MAYSSCGFLGCPGKVPTIYYFYLYEFTTFTTSLWFCHLLVSCFHTFPLRYNKIINYPALYFWISNSTFWRLVYRIMASLMAQWAKNLPAIQETQKTRVWSPGQEDPLEKEMATHSSTLAWEIPWTEKPGRHIWDVINFLFYTLSDPSILLGLWFRAAHWDDVLKICLLCCYRHVAYDFSLAGVLKVHLAFSFPSPQHIKHYLWNPPFLPGVLVQIAQNQISSESQACIYQTLGIASA